MNNIANIIKVARSASSWLRATCPRVLEHALSALVWFILCGGVGAGLIVDGVWLLAGEGWACIAGGLFMLLAAGIVYRGINA